MFMGEFRHSLDAKGRLTLPSKFREKLAGVVVVTKGFDGCLNIYAPPQWEAFYEKLVAMPANKKDARALVRVMTSKATEVEIDKMGRINIPSGLRQEARLEKDAVIIGSLNHIEVWDPEVWDQYYEKESRQLERISEELDFDL